MDKKPNFIDEILDKNGTKAYTETTRERLIRKTFPWIDLIASDYSFINTYLHWMSTKEIEWLVKLIMTFYWNSAWTLMAKKKHSETSTLEGLVTFCETLILLSETLDSNKDT